MSTTTNAGFIDSLLDNWDTTTKPYFANATTNATTGTPPSLEPTVFTSIQEKIKSLYLVFHYPQYTDTTASTPTEFTNGKPEIKSSDRIFNYIDGTTTTEKKLLSSKGISKDEMVSLKMILAKLVETNTTAETAYTILNEQYTFPGTAGSTLGGNNNTLIPKTGGKGKNKSSKRVKKHPRRRNKSSKSLI